MFGQLCVPLSLSLSPLFNKMANEVYTTLEELLLLSPLHFFLEGEEVVFSFTLMLNVTVGDAPEI